MKKTDYDRYMGRARGFRIAGNILRFGLLIAGIAIGVNYFNALYIQPSGSDSELSRSFFGSFNRLILLEAMKLALPFITSGLVFGSAFKIISKKQEKKALDSAVIERKKASKHY